MVFASFTQLADYNLLINAIINLAPQRISICKIYSPWDSTTLIGYWATWTWIACSRISLSIGYVACDCLVTGLMYRISAQLRILRIRLRDLTTLDEQIKCEKTDDDIEQLEMKTIAELILEHQEIIELRKFEWRRVEFFFVCLFFTNNIIVYTGWFVS